MEKKTVWMVQMKNTALKVRKFLNKWVNAPVSYFIYLGYKFVAERLAVLTGFCWLSVSLG
jgi:hypothetical protein